MPFKIWAVGEEVLAADFNDFLQEQVVATFPTAAARDAAIIAPNEGQLAYVVADKTLYRWDGAAWITGAALIVPKALARWRQPAAQSIPGQTVTVLTGLTADVLKGGITFANNAFTVPRAGHYRIGGQHTMNMSIAMQSGNPTAWAYVRVNGAATLPGPTSTAQVAGQIVNGTQQSAPYSRILPLNAGDVVDFQIQHTWTANLNTQANMSWGDIEELGVPL